jgi:hypothetical protein
VAHRLIGAQNAQIGTALVLIGLELKPAQMGGYLKPPHVRHA